MSQVELTAVEIVFSRLACYYGTRLADLWQGVDQTAVKFTWSQRLAQYSPEVIQLALDACEDRETVPNLPAFTQMLRDAARRHQSYVRPSLPAPAVSREVAERRKAELSKLTPLSKEPGREWAYALRQRYLAGERLLLIQVDMASEALGETWRNGTCEVRRVAA